MKIEFTPGSLRETRPHEYAVRFLFGGLVTALTGWIASKYGPVVGGLFLAFPAIFPASATLVASHERKKFQNDEGKRRGEQAAGVDAAGAALGSLALLAFGGIVWGLGAIIPAWAVLALAGCAWVICSILFWAIRQKL